MEETKNSQEPSKAVDEKTKSQVNAMAVISYIGFLCFVPLLTKEQDEFVKFHAKRGLIIFIGEFTTWIMVGILPVLFVLGNLLGIFWLVLSIMGILNVIKNEKKEIPLVGKFADKIKI